jgi:hypothetical protein
VKEKRYGFPVIDKTGKTAVCPMFGAIRKVAGKFYQTFPAGIRVIP